LVFVTETQCIFSAAGTEILNILINMRLQRFKKKYMPSLGRPAREADNLTATGEPIV
jgi:hypothetical protein